MHVKSFKQHGSTTTICGFDAEEQIQTKNCNVPVISGSYVICDENGDFLGLKCPEKDTTYYSLFIDTIKTKNKKETKESLISVFDEGVLENSLIKHCKIMTQKELNALVKHFKTLNKYLENPYCSHGAKVRFKVLDTLAIKLAKVDRVVRCKENVHHHLKNIIEQHGHVCYPTQSLISEVCRIDQDFDVDLVKQCVDLFNQINGFVYTPTSYTMETYIAKKVQEYLMEKFTINVADLHMEKLNKKQQSIVRTFLSGSNLAILTGFPGTGKSAVTKTIMEFCEDHGISVLLCAPTGKAANRLGPKAMTIHRALDCKFVGSSVVFKKNEMNPLKEQVIIVDESSMLDTYLTCSLLKACSPSRTKLMFVGDRQQLPSVQYGDILRSLIHSGKIPTVDLTTIYRQDSGSNICKLSKMISTGKIVRDVLDKNNDIIWKQEKDQHKILEQIHEIYKSENNIQLLCPSKKGMVGSKNINEYIHNKLFEGETDMRIGDKVICVQNCYKKCKDDVVDLESSVFNGEVGTIIDYGSKDNYLIRFEQKEVALHKDYIEYAYCITVHKSQGSEYETVVLVLDKAFDLMLNREILYTACTRCKKKLYIFSNDYCILKSANTPSKPRYTNLSKLICS